MYYLFYYKIFVVVFFQLNLQCSPNTIRRRLFEEGFSHRIPAEKLHLDDEHKLNRLRWADNNRNLPQDYWNLVVFADEKTFRSDTEGRQILRRRDNTR